MRQSHYLSILELATNRGNPPHPDILDCTRNSQGVLECWQPLENRYRGNGNKMSSPHIEHPCHEAKTMMISE
jgi:hypothetical protein